MNPNIVQLPLLDINETRRCNLGILEVSYEEKSIVLPLANVNISANVINQVSEVTHEQTFQNPFTEHLEATYIFPLPGGAAVSHFEMKVGDKVIIGKVKERVEARREYSKAVSEGKKAALLEQERDDIFTVQVGNIPPGKEIEVKITYSEKLPFFDNGNTEIRLPLVVAPRYNPGNILERDNSGKGVDSDTDIVSDASRISPPRLAPGFNPEINLKIKVEIFQSDNQNISEISCSQHATKTSFANNSIKILLSNTNELLNRDFVLRWQMTQETLKNDLVFYKDNDGNAYGMLTIIPPKREGFFGLSRDIVFIVDRSGSMEGIKMASAMKACSVLLDTLGPADRFSILAFDDQLEWFQPNNSEDKTKLFINADEAGIDKGNKFLREIKSRGGTEMDSALCEALIVLKNREKVSERIPVIVLLTDGQIGDESRVLKRIQREVGDSRIFTVGIDTAVNEHFLKRLATLSGGTSTFVVPGEQLETALKMVGREIGNPLLIDIKLTDENCGIFEKTIVPEKIPDLFAGRTVNVFFKAKNSGTVNVSGKFFQGEDFYTVVNGNETIVPAISQLWAKTKIFSLEDDFRICESSYGSETDKNKIKQEIIALSVKHSILTRFTAFIAVDENEITNKDGSLRKVVQPVAEPASWEINNNISINQPVHTYAKNMIQPPASAPVMRMAAPAPESMINTGSAPGGVLDLSGVQNTGQSWFVEKLSGFTEKILGNKSQKIVRDKSEMNYFIPIDKDLLEAISNLLLSFEDIVKQIKAKIVPDVSYFEKARNNLMQLLSNSDVAMELGNLQRFLRNEAVEFIAAIKTNNIKAENLLAKFQNYKASIELIKKEINLKNPETEAENFWESSI
jgi:Ca-activated chloride channel family protein